MRVDSELSDTALNIKIPTKLHVSAVYKCITKKRIWKFMVRNIIKTNVLIFVTSVMLDSKQQEFTTCNTK